MWTFIRATSAMVAAASVLQLQEKGPRLFRPAGVQKLPMWRLRSGIPVPPARLVSELE
jgi:hypothetical protein